MSDSAQLHIGGMIRTLVTAAIVGTVLVIVVEEALSAPSLATGEVEQVCGLCHVEWWRQAALVVGLGGLLVVANRLLGGRQPAEEDSDE